MPPNVCEKVKEIKKQRDEEERQKVLRHKEWEDHLAAKVAASRQKELIMRSGVLLNSPQWFPGLNDQETARSYQENQN